MIAIEALSKDSPDELIGLHQASDMESWDAVKEQVLRPFFGDNAIYRRF